MSYKFVTPLLRLSSKSGPFNYLVDHTLKNSPPPTIDNDQQLPTASCNLTLGGFHKSWVHGVKQ
jgi:hypothetical protein